MSLKSRHWFHTTLDDSFWKHASIPESISLSIQSNYKLKKKEEPQLSRPLPKEKPVETRRSGSWCSAPETPAHSWGWGSGSFGPRTSGLWASGLKHRTHRQGHPCFREQTAKSDGVWEPALDRSPGMQVHTALQKYHPDQAQAVRAGDDRAQKWQDSGHAWHKGASQESQHMHQVSDTPHRGDHGAALLGMLRHGG